MCRAYRSLFVKGLVFAKKNKLITQNFQLEFLISKFSFP
ncbi:unknown protein [Parachlamydia acanthamoebae UV-7]|uniref:Uncharacterized protein n=1 Tax=Parachlamydia acanthamoebae (strain UV7) TaxID=765952 RepID=F8KYH0_PARAV|nr:unknown protein [Parachlamydia acanthamoebae UV-7]